MTAQLSLAARLSVGGLFMAWGASKLRDLGTFKAAVRSYRLLPPSVAAFVAAPLAIVETAVGAALLVGFQLDVTAAAAIALLVIFAVAIGINLLRGRAIPCGCHTGVEDPISPRQVARNALLALMVSSIYLVSDRLWTIDDEASGAITSTGVDGVVAALLAIATWLLWTIGVKVIELARQTSRMFEEVGGNGNVDG